MSIISVIALEDISMQIYVILISNKARTKNNASKRHYETLFNTNRML